MMFALLFIRDDEKVFLTLPFGDLPEIEDSFLTFMFDNYNGVQFIPNINFVFEILS